MSNQLTIETFTEEFGYSFFVFVGVSFAIVSGHLDVNQGTTAKFELSSIRRASFNGIGFIQMGQVCPEQLDLIFMYTPTVKTKISDGLDTKISGGLDTKISGKLDTKISGELETSVNGYVYNRLSTDDGLGIYGKITVVKEDE